MRNHTTAVLLSIFFGAWGIDRFYVGNVGLGIAKFFLSWFTLGIWWFVDIILMATRKVKNVEWDDENTIRR